MFSLHFQTYICKCINFHYRRIFIKLKCDIWNNRTRVRARYIDITRAQAEATAYLSDAYYIALFIMR